MANAGSKPKNQKSKVELTSWGAHDASEPDDGGEDITCPSGQTCRVMVTPGIRGLVKLGVLDNMDSLSALVETEVVGPRQGKAPKTKGAGAKVTAGDKSRAQVKDLLGDPKSFTDAMDMVDKVVVAVVLDPPVLPAPEEGEERKAGAVYVDRHIRDIDKMFIFNHAVAGVRDLEDFRASIGQLVEGVDDGATVEEDA